LRNIVTTALKNTPHSNTSHTQELIGNRICSILSRAKICCYIYRSRKPRPIERGGRGSGNLLRKSKRFTTGLRTNLTGHHMSKVCPYSLKKLCLAKRPKSE